MAKTRVKKVVISGITSEQAEIAFSEFATADAKVQNIQSKMDMEITRIRDKYADALAERFVRGDESRSTEGSGLGLSISKMLTELMGGKFEISLEDDLFRVKVTFRCKE